MTATATADLAVGAAGAVGGVEADGIRWVDEKEHARVCTLFNTYFIVYSVRAASRDGLCFACERWHAAANVSHLEQHFHGKFTCGPIGQRDRYPPARVDLRVQSYSGAAALAKRFARPLLWPAVFSCPLALTLTSPISISAGFTRTRTRAAGSDSPPSSHQSRANSTGRRRGPRRVFHGH